MKQTNIFYALILFVIIYIVPIKIDAQTLVVTPERGVTHGLAAERANSIHNIEYNLGICISSFADSLSKGHVDIFFKLDKRQDVVLDFFDAGNIVGVSLPYSATNEHIVIPALSLKAGDNVVGIDFLIAPRLLNHRGNLVYTLSVPDKARRLFPCFDQPDMKATYRLTLTLPDEWKAVSNGAIMSSTTSDSGTIVRFAPTEPLSTYLFAFAAGEFRRHEMTRGGRTIALYHCETDSARVAQCDDILGEVFASLEWLEEYTAIPYPFAKYDLVVIPGFQFGGMEHTGATLYNDRLLFLPPYPTLDERLARTSLIAHETAHMWFGDYVTMKWFGEVWTKEVFANYYAACMAGPLYQDVNHKLRFMLSYAPAAYAEDRTAGANPIQQQLDNLCDAGLIYGNIIYNKSPMMMRQLVGKIGDETFRLGIQRYLRQHAYSNATWNGLIAILDSLTTENLTEWSDNWVNGVGMPVYKLSRDGRMLTISSWDGTLCPQKVTLLVDGKEVFVDCSSRVVRLCLPSEQSSVIPNADGMAYGYFAMDSVLLRYSIDCLSGGDELVRGAVLINLNEALWRGDIDSKKFITFLTEYIGSESNPLLYSLAVGYLKTAHTRYADAPDMTLENALSRIVHTDPVVARKVIALRALAEVMDTNESIAYVRSIWNGESCIDGFKLSDIDAMRIAWQLAVRLPDEADNIIAQQRCRLTSDNLKREFDFVSPAVSPRLTERDALFSRLLTPEGRSVEPWAENALSLLNHRYRRDENMRYVWRGLEAVEDVKRTGDIFFPKRWVSMLLSGHRPDEARSIVERFLASRPYYPEMLKRKILMNVGCD